MGGGLSCHSHQIQVHPKYVTLHAYYGTANIGTDLQTCYVSTVDKATSEYPIFGCSFSVSTVPLPGTTQFSVWNLSIPPPYKVRNPLGTAIV